MMPPRKDMEAELAGATVYSRLDTTPEFHQIPLDDSTSRICTFSTPFSRYRFLRLPFGMSSAPEVFQNTLNAVFERLPGVKIYVDDNLVLGSSVEEHNERLKIVLLAAKRAGLAFSTDECSIGVLEIEFLGGVIDKAGRAGH